MAKILVAEDDGHLCHFIEKTLIQNNYTVLTAGNGTEALKIFENSHIDLIICDIMMPKMDGYELTHLMRSSGFTTPILIITAKDTFDDMKKGFKCGADDYMMKPININELILRVQALLRRAKIADEKKIIMGSTTLDVNQMTVICGNEKFSLRLKEFMMLYKLLSYPNKIFTRQQLMDEIWGMDSESDERTVDVHISRLREKFKDNKDFSIETIRGLGYKAVK